MLSSATTAAPVVVTRRRQGWEKRYPQGNFSCFTVQYPAKRAVYLFMKVLLHLGSVFKNVRVFTVCAPSKPLIIHLCRRVPPTVQCTGHTARLYRVTRRACPAFRAAAAPALSSGDGLLCRRRVQHPTADTARCHRRTAMTGIDAMRDDIDETMRDDCDEKDERYDDRDDCDEI